MNRLCEIEIGGITYPLNFSVKAARLVEEKFGGVHKVTGVYGKSADLCTTLNNQTWLLQLLMEQGAKYKKLVDGEDIELPTDDEIEVLIGALGMKDVQIALFGCIGISLTPTVEVETDPKNAETTQSN